MTMCGGECRSAKPADQRMARTGGQSKPPGGDIPDEGSNDCAQHGRHRDDVCVDETLPYCRSNRAAEKRACEIEKRRHRNRLARRQNSGRNNGSNRIGGVVKAVAVFKDDRRENDGKKRKHSRSRLRILQRHFENDISRIPTAVDDFFHQLEQIAQKNDLLRFVITLVKIAQQIELKFVGLALNRLQLCVHLTRRRRISALAQLPNHGEHSFCSLLEKFHLPAETASMQIFRTNQDAFADFLHRLRDFIKRGRQRLNIFTFEWRDEFLAKLFSQLLRDLLVFPPAAHKFFQTLRRIFFLKPLQQCDQMVHAGVCLLRAGLQQIEKLLVVAENFLDRQHKP